MSRNQSPLVWHAQGDADEYCLLTQDGRWVIAFRMQGEKTTADQQDILRHMVASANACRKIDTATLEELGTETTLAKIAMRQLERRDILTTALADAADYLRNCANSPSIADKCEAIIAGIRGPWCCKKGQAQSKRVCDECADINDGYQSCLGVSPKGAST